MKQVSNIIAETENLVLRRYKKSDLNDLYEYLSDADVVKFEPYKPMSISEVESNLEWRISTDEMIAVELKSNHKMIGNVYLGKRDFETLEIGYVFHKEYWGQGYAKESCKELISLAFSKGVHRIFAECDPQNIGSWKLLEALGFEKEAHLKKNVYFWKDENNMPIWKDTYIYSKLNECDYIIRELQEKEYPLLNEFLYEAIFIPGGVQAPSKSIIELPELQVYVKDFGKQKDDICFLAEIEEKPVGAVWVRVMNDYGHTEDGVPSMAISLYKEYRGLGIGTALMKKMLHELEQRGYEKTSLSVQKENYAVNMYKKVGYEIITENEEEYIMVCRLRK